MSTPAKLAGCGTSKSHPDTLATHGPIVEETWSIEESKSPVDDSPQVAGMLYADSSTDPSYLMLPTAVWRSVLQNNRHLTYATSHDEGQADRGEYRQAAGAK